MIQPDAKIEAFRQFELTGWERTTDPYHRFFGPITSNVIAPLLDAARVSAGRKVLDVGTGPGYVAAEAARRGAVVTGVDFSEQMVALARRLHSQVEFRVGDAEHLPFANESFNAVVGNFIVPHLSRPEVAAAEFARVLRRGGYLGLSMWDVPDRARILGVVYQAAVRVGAPQPASVPPGPPFFMYSTDEALSGLLRLAGLTNAIVDTIAFSHRVPHADALWNGLLAGTVRLRAFILGQPADIQQKIRAAFEDLVREYAVASGLELPVSVKVASGRKVP